MSKEFNAEVATVLEGFLAQVSEQDFETEEEEKLAIEKAQEAAYQKVQREKSLEDVIREHDEGYGSLIEPEEEKTEEEVMAVGEAAYKKIKVSDIANAKLKFAAFRANQWKIKVKLHLRELDRQVPLFDKDASTMGSQYGHRSRHLSSAQKCLHHLKGNAELYGEYKAKCDFYQGLLNIYSSIFIHDFEDVEQKIEMLSTSNKNESDRKEEVTKYFEKAKKEFAIQESVEQEKAAKEQEKQKEEQKQTCLGYTYAETVKDVSKQYKKSAIRTIGDLEMQTSAAIKMLRIAIENGEPLEVVEYRNARTREMVDKFIKKTVPKKQVIYNRAYLNVVELFKQYKPKENQEEKETEKQEDTTYEPVEAFVSEHGTEDIRDIQIVPLLKRNASLGKDISKYMDCTSNIQKVLSLLQGQLQVEDSQEKVMLENQLEQYQYINDFQKKLCSYIEYFANSNAAMNRSFWNEKQEEFAKAESEIHANLSEGDVQQFLSSLMEECKKQISITEENYRTFRENGGKTPDEMSSADKGKEIRKTFDIFRADFMKQAPRGKIADLMPAFVGLEQTYEQFKNDTNIFKGTETFESLMHPYTRESVEEVDRYHTLISANTKEISQRLFVMEKSKNAQFLKPVGDMLTVYEQYIRICKEKHYDTLFGVDIAKLENTYADFKQKYEKYSPSLQNKSAEESMVHAQSKIEKLEKELSVLMKEQPINKTMIFSTQYKLKKLYSDKYNGLFQKMEAGMKADQALYQQAENAFQANNLDLLDDIVDKIDDTCDIVQKEVVGLFKAIEKDKAHCKTIGLGDVTTERFDRICHTRLAQLKENKEAYAVKSNELASKINMTTNVASAEQEKDLARVVSEIDKEVSSGKDVQGGLQPIVVSKMPEEELINERVSSDAFQQRVNQLTSVLNHAPQVSSLMVQDQLKKEKTLIEQNKHLFTEEQMAYLESLLEKGESFTRTTYKTRK